MKPFKFESSLRKPHLFISMRLEVIQWIVKWFYLKIVYSRCRLDLEIRGNSLQEDKWILDSDIWNID